MTPLHTFVDDLIGTPWDARGHSAEAWPQSFDCYGLIRYCYGVRLGIDLPLIKPAQYHLRPITDSFTLPGPYQHFDMGDQKDYQSFDVITLSQGARAHHVGLVFVIDGNPRVVHCVDGVGVISQDLTSLGIGGWHIVGHYRHRTLIQGASWPR